jgi:23S rRNA pseudouridine1911/1915/1917 synthase
MIIQYSVPDLSSAMPAEPIHCCIPEACAGMRLDQALAGLLPAYSRSRLQQWIKAGYVEVDGKTVRPRAPVLGGERVRVVLPQELETVDLAQAIPLDIRYEDADLLVINKPAGLVVHPAAGNPDGTLVNALLHYAPELAALPRAGLVHRLDKDTSGLLVVARRLRAHTSLVAQLQARTLEREYQAVVTGVMIAGGRIEAPVGRHPVDRKRMAVTAAGKPAVTHYRVIRRFRAHTQLWIKLETGRTHQIRVHLAHIRYPLVGDPVYGGRRHLPAGLTDRCLAVLQGFKRQALHATQLALVHPGSGERLAWRVEPPADMVELLAVLAEAAS